MASALDWRLLDEFVAALVAELSLAGAALALAKDGALIYMRGFGAYAPSRRVPIASGSKWLSAAVIATLLEDGLLHLDDRAGDYIPEFGGDKYAITLRQLLAHTSGLPAQEHPCLNNPHLSLAECVQRIAEMPLQYPPGVRFAYTENGYQVAARMAEVATAKSWWMLFQERLAAPLAMQSVDFGWRSSEDGVVSVSNPRVGSGIRINLEDYARFLQMWSSGGSLSSRRVLSPSTIALMSLDHTAGATVASSPNRFPQIGYGLGCWRDEVDREGRAVLISSPGVFGFTPWWDARCNVAGALLVRDTYQRIAQPARALQQLVRSLLAAG